MTETLVDTIHKPAALLEHLDALQKHFALILIGLFICVAIFFLFTPKIVDYLAHPIVGISALRAIDVTESIGVFMKVALVGGWFCVSLTLHCF
jgi:Sec-independent protein secretion pathway component TatC